MTYISTSINQVHAEIKKEAHISVMIKEITTEETPAPLIGLSEKEKAELDKSGHKKILQLLSYSALHCIDRL